MIFSEYRQQYDFIENNQIKSIDLKNLHMNDNIELDLNKLLFPIFVDRTLQRNLPQLKQFIIEKLENPIEYKVDFINARYNFLKYAYKINIIYLSPNNYNSLFNLYFPNLIKTNMFVLDDDVICFDSSVTDLEIKFELDIYI